MKALFAYKIIIRCYYKLHTMNFNILFRHAILLLWRHYLTYWWHKANCNTSKSVQVNGFTM